MRRRKAGLVALAKKIRAVGKGGRPDWYAVAEWLAETAFPQLLIDPPNNRGGRPAKNREAILYAVERVRFNAMKSKQPYTLADACRDLAKTDDWSGKDWEALRKEYNQARHNFTDREWAALQRECSFRRQKAKSKNRSLAVVGN
jgi:hypothetical protein